MPISRPACVQHTLANFARQETCSRLILVLNGPAQQAVVPPGSWEVLRCVGGTPARARNAGLERAKELGGPVIFWDDDDYYGSGYVTEALEQLEGNPRRVLGKPVRFVEFDDGIFLFLGRQGVSFLGGTMAGWAEELPAIPDLACGEDLEWCRLLLQLGFELRSTGGRHYLYNRKRGIKHAWNGTLVQMLYCYGPALNLGMAGSEVVDGKVATGIYCPRASIEDIEYELIQQLQTSALSEVELQQLLS